MVAFTAPSVMQFPGFIRPATPADLTAIDALLLAACPTAVARDLVRDLRAGGAIRGEQVIPLGTGVIGYYALSAMRAPAGWLCLAPVAIAPDWQGRGHGRRLVAQLAAWADATGTPVVATGPAQFLTRSGCRATDLMPDQAAPTLIAGAGGVTPSAALRYPAAFG